MLSWCVQGFPRRIVRLLSDHYPECALSLVEEEDGTYLRIEKLPFILEAEKKMADMKKGSSIELIRFGKESYRKDLFDKEKPLREGRDPSDFVLYLSGQPRAIALWCMDTGSLLSIPKLELKTNEDGSFSIWYSK
jgi:hypothetical protein